MVGPQGRKHPRRKAYHQKLVLETGTMSRLVAHITANGVINHIGATPGGERLYLVREAVGQVDRMIGALIPQHHKLGVPG